MNDEVRSLCRSDFVFFAIRSWKELNGELMSEAKYLEYICLRLHHFGVGEDNRLALFAPPRHGKSLLTSVLYPAWLLLRDPATKVICLSHDEKLVSKHHSDTRRLMSSPFYRELTKGFSIVRDTDDLIQTNQGGFRSARILGGNITGHGGDVLIVDDPVNAKNVHSETILEKAKEDFRYLFTRADDPKRTRYLLAMQRLRTDDIGAMVLDWGWSHLTLPLVAPWDEEWRIGDRLIYRRPAGEYLEPNRMGAKEQGAYLKEIGSRNFSAQYLQDPQPDGGGIVQWNWFKFFDRLPDPERIIQSWDVATTMSGGDYSACTTWGYAKGHFYLLDVTREQVDMPTFLRRVRMLAKKYRPDKIVIEAVGIGKAACQLVLDDFRKTGEKDLIAPATSNESKVERLDKVTPLIEAGEVFLPRSAQWLEAFRAEITAFPHGKHDDMVDSFSQFLNYRNDLLRRTGCSIKNSRQNEISIRLYGADTISDLAAARGADKGSETKEKKKPRRIKIEKAVKKARSF